LLSAEDYFDPTALESDFFNQGEKSPEMDRVLQVVSNRLFGKEQVQAPCTMAEREQILAHHPNMLLSYLDLAISYAGQWRLDEAERVLHRAADKMGGRIPEILHYLACVSFARRDFAAAQRYFHRGLDAAPRDTSLIRNWKTLQAAGRMDYQRQAEVAQQLFANLRSTELLYLPDGTRQLTTAPLSADD